MGEVLRIATPTTESQEEALRSELREALRARDDLAEKLRVEKANHAATAEALTAERAARAETAHRARIEQEEAARRLHAMNAELLRVQASKTFSTIAAAFAGWAVRGVVGGAK